MHIRHPHNHELQALGALIATAYEQLDGIPSRQALPDYYAALDNVGALTRHPGVQAWVAVEDEHLLGGVLSFADMRYYGSGGTAPSLDATTGVRFLGVSGQARGRGVGKALIRTCIDSARSAGHVRVVLHTTAAMKTAWAMYERMGFARAPELDFVHGDWPVYGLRMPLDITRSTRAQACPAGDASSGGRRA